MTAACVVSLRDLHLLADIGVHHHEIGRPQPLILHVALAVRLPTSDAMGEAFDYTRIRELTERLSLERIVLIETFASRVAEWCLDDNLVRGVCVRVDKPRGVPGAMASATVRMGERVDL